MQNVKIRNALGVLLLVLLAVGLAAGTFFDLDISKAVVNVDNPFGNFLEIWAEPPSLLLVSLVFCLEGQYLRGESGKKNKYLSLLCYVSGVIAAYSTVYRTVRYYSSSLSAQISAKIVIGIASVVITVLFALAATHVKHETLKKMRYSMVLLIASALATLVIISAVKNVWGRVRYRQLFADGSFDGFTAWFKPCGHASSDGYKSFPSGHTSNATLLFAATYMIKDLKGEKAAFVARCAAVAWICTVMVSRVLCGAHFLSDVCMGAILTTIIIFVCKKIFYKPAERKG